MIDNLYILKPEIFLSISILIILMIGVFIKKSYSLINNLSLLIMLILIIIIFNGDNNSTKIFSDSFIRDSYSNYIKI